MAGEDGDRAVDLLGEHDAGELVGKGDESEREQEVGALAGGVGPAVGRADGEHQRAGCRRRADARCARRNPPTRTDCPRLSSRIAFARTRPGCWVSQSSSAASLSNV